MRQVPQALSALWISVPGLSDAYLFVIAQFFRNKHGVQRMLRHEIPSTILRKHPAGCHLPDAPGLVISTIGHRAIRPETKSGEYV